jgi:hypothetical protein
MALPDLSLTGGCMWFGVTDPLVVASYRLRVWPPGGGAKWFCGECGSALFGRNPVMPIRSASGWGR